MMMDIGEGSAVIDASAIPSSSVSSVVSVTSIGIKKELKKAIIVIIMAIINEDSISDLFIYLNLHLFLSARSGNVIQTFSIII